jgi:hypothetical protein
MACENDEEETWNAWILPMESLEKSPSRADNVSEEEERRYIMMMMFSLYHTLSTPTPSSLLSCTHNILSHEAHNVCLIYVYAYKKGIAVVLLYSWRKSARNEK